MVGRWQEAVRFFAFLAGMLALAALVVVGCAVYERSAFQAYRLGIGSAPLFTPYYVWRLILLAALSLTLVAGLYRRRGIGTAFDQRELSAAQHLAVYALIAAASVWLVLFVADPARFQALAQEDQVVEWLSALVPLASSVAFGYAFWIVLRSRQRSNERGFALSFTALFAAALFVVGMEEISWMQRVFDIPTPAMLSGNEQNETNLHNLHSLFFNIVYRTAVFGGLIVLPFIAETAPKTPLLDRMQDLLPSRFVLAASAPLLGFDYNFWNFALAPLLLLMALAILMCYARAAWKYGDYREAALFAFLAIFAVASQVVFLALGEGSGRTWVISEYRELLLAIGLGVYTAEVTARLRTRYAMPPVATSPIQPATPAETSIDRPSPA